MTTLVIARISHVLVSKREGRMQGVMAAEMKDEYTIREGTFQHIVLEGTSYEVGKMQGEIIKETASAEAMTYR
jgi:hypothetical protein